MKLSITVAILITLHGPGILPVDIDFSHRRISREVTACLGTSDYKVEELHKLSNITANGNIAGRYFKAESREEGTGRGKCYYYAGRVYTCPHGGCSGNEDISGTTEYFDYVIVWDSLKSVQSISIFNYQATHGQEVCAIGWLKQFTGFRGERSLRPGKNIDAISGATKSVSAIVEDISLRTAELAGYAGD